MAKYLYRVELMEYQADDHVPIRAVDYGPGDYIEIQFPMSSSDKPVVFFTAIQLEPHTFMHSPHSGFGARK